VRAQGEFPAVGEVLELFTMPHIVQGWRRGSHYGPLMPCRFADAHPSRYEGPPRVLALGFQVADGTLAGPRNMFNDPVFDEARRLRNIIADHLRRHGPFEPHRLPMEEMEYTTLPEVMAKLADRWQPLTGRRQDLVPEETVPAQRPKERARQVFWDLPRADPSHAGAARRSSRRSVASGRHSAGCDDP
jgi:fructose 1,6-bisphosphate aldolase/phosphatase